MSVGERLRAARESRGVSMRRLAELSGRSASSISQIERGLVEPRMSTLVSLTVPLGITVAQLMSDEDAIHRPLRRADRIELRFGSKRREYPLTRRPFSNLEVYLVVLEPGGTSDNAPVTHGNSDEFCLVLTGSDLWFESGEERHTLHTGDSVEFRSSTPHWVVNKGSEVAELVWAISPPTPEAHLTAAQMPDRADRDRRLER